MTSDVKNRHGLPLFAAAWAAFLLAPAAAGAMVADDPFAGLAPVGRGELGQMRGGMMIGAIPVDFAVVVSTTIQQASQPLIGLQTMLAINNAGAIDNAVTTAIAGALPSVTATAPAAPAVSGGPASPVTADASAAPDAAPTVTAAVPATSGNAASAAISGPAATIIQQITNNQVQTLVTNAASGVQISHITDVNVTLPGLLQASQTFSAQLQAAHMGMEAALAGLHR